MITNSKQFLSPFIFKNISRIFLLLIGFCIVTTSCASFKKLIPPGAKKEEVKDLFNKHLVQADLFHGRSEFYQELLELNILLTIKPEDEEIVDRKKYLEEFIKNSAIFELNLVEDFFTKFNIYEAQKHLLQVLRIDPFNEKAKDYLHREFPHIIHEIQQGETLNSIAKLYFNDIAKSEFIKNFNAIEDPKKIKAGSHLKIPVLKGYTLKDIAHIKNELIQEKPPSVAVESSEDEQEVNIEKLVAMGAFSDAIILLKELALKNPDNFVIIEKLKDTYLKMIQLLYDSSEYFKVIQTIHEMQDLVGKDKKTGEILSLSETNLRKEIEDLYIKGMEYYRQDKLQEAIDVWNQILAWKPDHAEAQKAIKKARELIEKLEKAKEKVGAS